MPGVKQAGEPRQIGQRGKNGRGDECCKIVQMSQIGIGADSSYTIVDICATKRSLRMRGEDKIFELLDIQVLQASTDVVQSLLMSPDGRDGQAAAVLLFRILALLRLRSRHRGA